VKTLVFLSRKSNSSACSSEPVSVLRQTAMSGTLWSNGTFFKSPSILMAFLNSARAFALRGTLIVGLALILLLGSAHSCDRVQIPARCC
jgi:hypothetical protein